jgi:hypothetical protein
VCALVPVTSCKASALAQQLRIRHVTNAFSRMPLFLTTPTPTLLPSPGCVQTQSCVHRHPWPAPLPPPMDVCKHNPVCTEHRLLCLHFFPFPHQVCKSDKIIPLTHSSRPSHPSHPCRDLDQTGALWMVVLPNECDTHPANTLFATPDIPNIPALVRARPTMVRPPWVLENDASADVVAQFNRAWLTFDD